MALLTGSSDYTAIGQDLAQRWRNIPPAIASDALNRGGALPAAVRPVRSGAKLFGQARTLQIMVADSQGLHMILPTLRPGEVLLIDASGYLENACFGAMAARVAQHRGAAGVVTDGAVRDLAELREMQLEVYCAGATPRGPHRGFGGRIDMPIAIGSAPVSPGDLVLGDDDGIVIVPLSQAQTLIERCEKLVAQEAAWVTAIDQGTSTAELLGMLPAKP